MLSIIVPCHNDAKYLRDLFLSIFHNLDRRIVTYEVIAVNNGSSDNTSEIIRDFEVKEIRVDEKLRPSRARNLGVERSQGSLLVFLDADVLVTKSWADEIILIYNRYRDTGENVFTGDYYHISKEPSWIEGIWFSNIYQKSHSYICGGNIVVTKDVYNSVNGFSEKLETGEDVNFSHKCIDYGVPPTFNKKLYVYHEGYPKTIIAFVKREIWHGKSDFSSISSFFKSKVAMLACLFSVFNIVLFFSVLTLNWEMAFFSLLVLLSFLIVILINNKINVLTSSIFKALLVAYLYLLGRSLSFFKIFSL